MTKINGYKINRSHGRTGYAGSCFSTHWRGAARDGGATPFIAAVWMPDADTEEYQIISGHVSKGTTAIHLGYYDDSRKAAYVVAMYQNDPNATVQLWIAHNKQIEVEYPEELFDLPEYLTLEAAQRMLAGRGAKVEVKTGAKHSISVAKINKTHKTLVDFMGNCPATASAMTVWGDKIFIDLAKKYGKETVMTARQHLTVNEFSLRFGLAA